MKNSLFIFSLTFYFLSSVTAAAQSNRWPSPDGRLQVTVSSTGRHCASRIVVSRAPRRRIFQKTLTKGTDALSVNRGEWSSDGQFFVFNGQSCEGHQPWHSPVYVYSRRENQVLRLDNYVGSIVMPEIKLQEGNKLETKKLGPNGDTEGKSIIVDLERIRRRAFRRG